MRIYSTSLRLLAVCLPALSLLAGCGTSSPKSGGISTPSPDLTGNWQIQSAAVANTTSLTGVVLFGSMRGAGNQVTGTFRFTNFAQQAACALDQVVTLSGSVNSSRSLTLSSAALADGSVITIKLTVPAVLTDFANGTIQVSGGTCAVPSAGAIGVQLASASGTYSGPLTPGTIGAPAAGTAGTGTLTLNESSTPSSDGQFPVTGTLSYVFGTCTGAISLKGDHSGVGLMLTAPSQMSSLSTFTLVGSATPTASQVAVGFLAVAPAPCSTSSSSSATYSGTLTRP